MKPYLHFICVLAFFLAFFLGLSAADVPLSVEKGVIYRYLDADGQVIPGSRMGDPGNSHLNDGAFDTEKVAQTVFRERQEKTMHVRFEFPLPVTISQVQLGWMWGHNGQHWFDMAEISAGNSAGELKSVCTFPNPGDRKQNSTVFAISFPKPVTARYFEVTITQKAALGRFLFSISEISLCGPESQLEKLRSAGNRETGSLEFERHAPCNIFDSAKTVEPVVLAGLQPAETGTLRYAVYNYFGDRVDDGSFSLRPGKNPLPLGTMEPGYYTLETEAELTGTGGTVRRLKGTTSFAVQPYRLRSRKEAKAADARFGIQLNFGSPEMSDALTRLGMPFRRGLLCFGPMAGTCEKPEWRYEDNFLQQYFIDQPKIGCFEIKTFPAHCTDDTGDPNWTIQKPTRREAYMEFVREQIRRVPIEQNLFEIWNEPWDHISAGEFAELAQWTVQAIKSVRPDAQAGPNLGPMGHLAAVCRAGGMKDMDFLTIHPYSPDFTSSPEASELRQRIRNYRKLLREELGRELPLYVTEIGWPTPPRGPFPNTERQQAAYTARASLIMLAEDIRGIMPYCIGQSEQDPADKEHFFGFFRKNGTPKPVVAAYATTARLFEGSRFIGDLRLGTDIGAMLFRRPDGTRIAALYADGTTAKILFRPDAEAVTLTDITGRERRLEVRNGRLPLTLTDDPIYLTGVGPALEKQLSQTNGNWSRIRKRGERECRRADNLETAFAGKAPQWKISLPGVPDSEFSARWDAAWNSEYLFLNFDITDAQPGLNPAGGAHVWNGDAIELFISTDPERIVPGFLKSFDHQLLFTPFGNDGRQEVAVYGVCGREGLTGQTVPGAETRFTRHERGWTAQLAIPFAALGLPDGPGETIALETAVDDLGRNYPRRQATSNSRADNSDNPAIWSLLRLKK